MTDKEKYLLLGAIALGGIGWWWYSQHTAAAAQIVSQPAATPVSGSSGVANSTTSMPSVSPPIVTASGAGANPNPAVNQSYLTALITWTNQTQNPALYAAMMNQLTASQVDLLYNILTTEWTTGASPTVTQTTFWNGLVAQYPFLRTGGKGCTNFTCT